MTRIRRAAAAARVTLYLGIVAYLATHLWAERDLLDSQLQRLDAGQVILAEGCVLAGAWLGMLGWRQLIVSDGTVLGVRDAAALYFTAALTKYLPGGLWPAVSLAERGRRHGLSGRHLALAFLLSVALSVLAGLAVGAPALAGAPLGLSQRMTTAGTTLLITGGVLAAGGAVGAVLLRRRHSSRGPAVGQSAASVFTAGALKRGAPLALLLILAGWVVSGLHLSVLVAALGDGGTSAAVLALCVYALAATAGVLAVVAPAGLGAREVVMGALLAGSLAEPAVLAAVAVSRLLVTAADVLAAAGAQLAHRRATVHLHPVPVVPAGVIPVGRR